MPSQGGIVRTLVAFKPGAVARSVAFVGFACSGPAIDPRVRGKIIPFFADSRRASCQLLANE